MAELSTGLNTHQGASKLSQPQRFPPAHTRQRRHRGVRDELGSLIQMGVLPAPTMPASVDA